MRAVYINPADRSVTEVELDGHNPASTVIQLLGGDAGVVVLGSAVFNQENGDALYTNSNHRKTDSAPDRRDIWAYLGQPMLGPGVIAGCNLAHDAEVPLERATGRTSFVDDLPPEIQELIALATAH